MPQILKKKRMEIKIRELKNVGLMGKGSRKNGDLNYLFLKSDLFPCCAYKESCECPRRAAGPAKWHALTCDSKSVNDTK